MSKKKSELKEVKVSEALTPEESKKYEVWAENRKRVTKLEEDEAPGQVRVVKDNGAIRAKFDLIDTFGASDFDAAFNLLVQVSSLVTLDNEDESKIETINRLIALLAGINPTDNMEAMLAAQMVATHTMIMDCSKRALLQTQTFEGKNMNLNQVNKLMRTYTTQMEALNKHRGKGQQKMTVEHVHVGEGGQAIIGSVEGGKNGK